MKKIISILKPEKNINFKAARKLIFISLPFLLIFAFIFFYVKYKEERKFSYFLCLGIDKERLFAILLTIVFIYSLLFILIAFKGISVYKIVGLLLWLSMLYPVMLQIAFCGLRTYYTFTSPNNSTELVFEYIGRLHGNHSCYPYVRENTFFISGIKLKSGDMLGIAKNIEIKPYEVEWLDENKVEFIFDSESYIIEF